MRAARVAAGKAAAEGVPGNCQRCRRWPQGVGPEQCWARVGLAAVVEWPHLGDADRPDEKELVGDGLPPRLQRQAATSVGTPAVCSHRSGHRGSRHLEGAQHRKAAPVERHGEPSWQGQWTHLWLSCGGGGGRCGGGSAISHSSVSATRSASCRSNSALDAATRVVAEGCSGRNPR